MADVSAKSALETNEHTKNLLRGLLRASSSAEAILLGAAEAMLSAGVNQEEDSAVQNAFGDAFEKGTNWATGTDARTCAHARQMRKRKVSLRKAFNCEQEKRRMTPPSAWM